MKANVTYWLDESAEKWPDKAAFADEEKTVTFRELQSQAKALAAKMIEKGLFKKPVVVYMEKGVDVLVSFMGAAYSCNFYSPIDVDMPASRINKILEVLQPALVITTAAWKETFEGYEYGGDFLLFEEACHAGSCDEKIETARRRGIDTDLLYVLFTSGSTGVPKGVTITHRSVIDYIDWVTETFTITESAIRRLFILTTLFWIFTAPSRPERQPILFRKICSRSRCFCWNISEKRKSIRFSGFLRR